MSRNLCTSYCVECTNPEPVHLKDLVGKPIEFRRYGNNTPVIGTKWTCPQCQTDYFAWWREGQWSDFQKRMLDYVIDLSYYETFNDEPLYDRDTYDDVPWCLCTEDDEHQTVWGDARMGDD